jgi:predicted nucleotide-binding protein
LLQEQWNQMFDVTQPDGKIVSIDPRSVVKVQSQEGLGTKIFLTGGTHVWAKEKPEVIKAIIARLAPLGVFSTWAPLVEGIEKKTNPVYHLQIQRKSGPWVSKLDLTSSQLADRILAPYREGRAVTISGTVIDATDIGSVKICQTEGPSAAFVEGVRREKFRETGVMLTVPDVPLLMSTATDVTDEFITGPPGKPTHGGATRTVGDPEPRKVFVVHGRNLKARDALFAFLRSIELNPLEWSEAVKATGATNPYVGEVLNVAFSRAQAVVVLMTPDDEARLRERFVQSSDPPHETDPTPQARPNVLFEAGMAMGRCPERTVLVELGTLRPFSDIGGRHVVRLDNSGPRRQELADRLKTAGCPVSLAGTDWHTQGDFSCV